MKRQLLILIFSLLSLTVYAEKVLNVYIGSNYIADSTIARIQKQCKCRVVQSYFNDNEEMLAKIAAGSSGYNVIVATSYAVDELAKMGKINPLTLKLLPNLKNISSQFLNQAYDPGNKYSVPYAYTPVFLAYNKDKLNKLGITPNSWAVVFEPKYLSKLKGRITMFNSSRHIFAAALLYLGKDPNTINRDDLNKARELIEKASPYWAKFDSDSYYRGLLRGDIWLSMAYSIDIYKTMEDLKNSKGKIKLGALLQKEGNMYELDNMVIPISSPDLNLSYEFINNALNPQSAYELSNKTGSSIVNKIALNRLNSGIKDIDWIYPKNFKKMHTFKAYDPKTRILVNSMWSEIQMQCRQL
jgi:spermidine/putrescine transport system substrate-binding protein